VQNVAIIGAAGMLGSSLEECFQKNEAMNVMSYTKKKLDITNLNSTYSCLENVKPDIIILTAALTNVDFCEDEPDAAFSVNVIGVANVVRYCIEHSDVLLIYISSTGVYGEHKSTNYLEFDLVEPLTTYHLSKFLGEQEVSRHLSRYVIIRTGWLYGGSCHHKRNFVFQRVMEAKSKTEIYCNMEQFGNPTSTKTLSEQISIIIKAKIYGLYNCVDRAENISRADYVRYIYELLDIKVKIIEVGADYFSRVAKVSCNEAATNYKLDLLGLNIMPDWKMSLRNYIDHFSL
jgi:dTDP-4-dehydrorhamnose reductase